MANSFSSDDFFWETGAKQHLSRMLLDLPQSSQVKMEFGATFLEVRVDISPLTAEKPPPTRSRRHLPPSKVKRNRRRLLKFLAKGMQPDETQVSGHTPAAVTAPDEPQESGHAPAAVMVDHPPLEDGIPPSVTENLSSPASENGQTPVKDRPSSPHLSNGEKLDFNGKMAKLNKKLDEFLAKHSGEPATPYVPPHLRMCIQGNPANVYNSQKKNPVYVSSPILLTQNKYAAIACDDGKEHESTDETDAESAADEDNNTDDDPTREDVPAMDWNILQPVEDAVMTPSPAGNPQRKAASPRKIVKVRRKKKCKQYSCKAS